VPLKTIEPFECPVCLKGTVRNACIPLDVPIRDRQYTVPDASVMQCDSCDEIFFAPGQSDAVQRKAADAVRPELGLLTGKTIADFRTSLGLTQAQLEKAMAVPPKTVARWEIGSVLQSCAADRFLRVLMAHPELVAELLAQGDARRGKVAVQ
jgi:putative zinc finger/helix-turn-helix YgiT family protein